METNQSQAMVAKPLWISEGILLASAPVAAYLLGVAYISGYMDFFHIPSDFVSVNATALFSASTGILFVGVIVLLLFTLVFTIWPRSDNPILRRVLIIFPIFALLFIKLMLFGRIWH